MRMKTKRWLAKLRRRISVRGKRIDDRRAHLRTARVEYEQRGKLFRTRATPMVPPSRMAIENNFEEVATWLADLRSSLAASQQSAGQNPSKATSRRFWDFSYIREVTPATALLIASEYDRLQSSLKAKLGVYNRRRWRGVVRRVLEDIGFFDLLGIELVKPRRTKESEYVRIFRFEAGELLESERMHRFVEQLNDALIAADPSALQDRRRRAQNMRLVEGLIEATENTRLHAYPRHVRSDPHLAPKWWVAGAAYPAEKRLTLVVYDHGVTIPGSMEEGDSSWPGRAWAKNVAKRYATLRGRPAEISDHVAIRLAMDWGTSSTGKAHRGKGLPVLRQIVENCREGHLLVMSRAGEYVYRRGAKATARALPVELPGTLIVWNLSL
jgi:hypothetical protein